MLIKAPVLKQTQILLLFAPSLLRVVTEVTATSHRWRRRRISTLRSDRLSFAVRRLSIQNNLALALPHVALHTQFRQQRRRVVVGIR